MNQSNWNENLGLNMPPEKVAFLNAMLEEMGGKNKNEMMPVSAKRLTVPTARESNLPTRRQTLSSAK